MWGLGAGIVPGVGAMFFRQKAVMRPQLPKQNGNVTEIKW